MDTDQCDPVTSTSSSMPPDEFFNMIVQAPWEEDIVWSSEDYKASKQSAIAQSRAGWIPSGNIRTLQAFLANNYRKGKSFENTIIYQELELIQRFELNSSSGII